VKTNIYINIAVIGSVNQVLFNLLNKIERSGLYNHSNKINENNVSNKHWLELISKLKILTKPKITI
jgi:hypothetical protein